ncbi:spermidine synthase [Marinomonas sp. THO17]|uniref:spermidine synthase n=1 Tax=Marinomonas sp. THO17 TaxID=3149048 RepID=UPI00336C18D7
MTQQNLLHDSCDEFGPIRVFDDGQFRILSFADGDEQSRMRLSTPHVLQHEYTQAMMLALLFCQPKRVCLLGLGGGTLIHALYQAISGVHIHAVELRQEVLDAAEMFFKLPKGKRITLTLDNAIDHMASGLDRKVDLLLTDIYNTQGMDISVLAPSFVADCAKNIKEKGCLVLNCWLDQKHNEAFTQLIKQHFSSVYALDTGTGNWVIIALKQAPQQTGKELKNAAQKLSSELGFSLTKWLTRMTEL